MLSHLHTLNLKCIKDLNMKLNGKYKIGHKNQNENEFMTRHCNIFNPHYIAMHNI